MIDAVQGSNPDTLRAIGIIVGAHGLQGTVKIEPLSDFPQRFDSLQSVYLRSPSGVPTLFHVKRVKWAGAFLLMTIREISDRDAAAELRGWDVCVGQDDEWELPDDVYYANDLLGFWGIASDGFHIGQLTNILFGAQDILEFERAEGNLLVPFVSQWIGQVNKSKRTIEIFNWRDLVDAESVEPDLSDNDD